MTKAISFLLLVIGWAFSGTWIIAAQNSHLGATRILFAASILCLLASWIMAFKVMDRK